MVIQRIQTLWLIIAMGLMITSAAVSFGSYPALIVSVLTAILLAVSIFMYKNLRQQMLVTRVNILLTLASAITAATLAYLAESCICVSSWSLGAFIFECLALRGMRKDHKLLSGTDRLR